VGGGAEGVKVGLDVGAIENDGNGVKEGRGDGAFDCSGPGSDEPMLFSQRSKQ
jgi:hypothetical protein